MKPLSADGSVGPPHVRVGHRQASKRENPRSHQRPGIFFCSSAKPADVRWLPARDDGRAGFAGAKTGHSDSAHPWASPLRGAVNGVQNGSPAVLSGIKKKAKTPIGTAGRGFLFLIQFDFSFRIKLVADSGWMILLRTFILENRSGDIQAKSTQREHPDYWTTINGERL